MNYISRKSYNSTIVATDSEGHRSLEAAYVVDGRIYASCGSQSVVSWSDEYHDKWVGDTEFFGLTYTVHMDDAKMYAECIG